MRISPHGTELLAAPGKTGGHEELVARSIGARAPGAHGPYGDELRDSQARHGLYPPPKKGLFFRVPEMAARAARGAPSAPEGRREAPRSGAGCRAAAQSAAAGG